MFKFRSNQKELLDEENIPTADLYLNLKELNTINSLLGGHSVTLKGLKTLLTNKNRSYSVMDIGCGGGDNLKYLAKWARKNNYKISFTGVDLKSDCISYARNNCKNYPEINFIQANYKALWAEPKTYDIVFSALCCHHFNNKELTDLIAFKKAKANVGYFINDLHRHPFAYYSIAWLTKWFSNSYLVKNDAKLSVLRGFKKSELKTFFQHNVKIKWAWAFRWLIIGKV